MQLTFLLLASPAYAAGDMILFPDVVLTLLQLLPFLATMAVLQALLFKPMIAYLEDRDLATVGAREEAARLNQLADEKLTQLEEQMSAARQDVQELRMDARAADKSARDSALAEARKGCDGEIEQARLQIRAERDLAAKELERLSRALGQDISRKVLGRELGGSV